MGSGPAIASTSIETRTIHKVQHRILPFAFLLFFVSFLDRVNIGFAALTLNRELGITSQQYGLVAGIFFFGYFIFEIPSNLILQKIGARIWIARILITWGAVATLTGFVRNVNQLYAMRFLLGLAEAGYVPGIVLYLTHWFRQSEQARAIAFFNTGGPVTSILGAPISGFILDHAHWLGLSSWRWLLILEGIPAVICGFLTYFLLPDRPEHAKFLAADEKQWLRAAPRLNLFRLDDRLVHAELLGAAAREITVRSVFQQRRRTPGHDSLPCRFRRHDPCLPQFRPQTRAAIPCGNSSHNRRDSSRAPRYNAFAFLLRGAFVFASCRRFQHSWAFLGATQRIPDWILGSRGHRAD
jgi:Major Facilitator Superfamily